MPKETRDWRERGEMIALLPEGEDAALAELETMRELANRERGEDDPDPNPLFDWMVLQVRGEYGRRAGSTSGPILFTSSEPPTKASNHRQYATWRDIPLPELRTWIGDLRDKFTLRGVANLSGLSATAVHDFAERRTQPERATLRAFGELYMRLAGDDSAALDEKYERKRRSSRRSGHTGT